MRNVRKSATRRLYDSAPAGSINLGLGEPDFPTPSVVRREAIRVIEQEPIGYTANAGLQALRERVARYHSETSSRPYSPGSICVTNGAEEALFAVVMSMCGPGDEVLLPDPSFLAYPTLAEMAGKGTRRALAIILSPLRTEASWDRYMHDVAEARARVAGAPEVGFAPAWYERPRFVAAVADRTRAALDEVPADARASTPVVFTAHSVPVGMAAVSPYVSDLTAATRAVARRLGHAQWSIAYQSRSGSPRQPWLPPPPKPALSPTA